MNIIEEMEKYGGPIREFDSSAWERPYCFPESFTGFAGHFPGNPLLPAFIQICMARLLWESRQPGQDFRLKSAKFIRPVRPNDRILVRLAGRRAELCVAGQTCAAMRICP